MMSLQAKKIVASAAAVILVAAWFANGILENTYVGYPRTPNEQDGRTVAYAVKGVVVYITQSQQDLLSWIAWIEIASGAVVALVILLHRGDLFRSKN
jgi:hypothetical protein